MKSRQLSAACLCVFTFCLIASVSAENVRHDFSGVITTVNFPENDPFDGQIQVGTAFSGFYEFESEQLPRQGDACSEQCSWDYLIPPYSFNVDIGTVTVQTPVDFVIQLSDNLSPGWDNYTVSSKHKIGVLDESGWIASVNIGMTDATGTAINDASILPLDPPDPDDFLLNRDSHFWVLGYPTGYFQGRIDRFVRVPVVKDVTIDIKPGTDPNTINVRSQGVIPVAILTTDDFDASRVDVDTVEFAGAAPQDIYALEDVDGDMDLVFNLAVQYPGNGYCLRRH